MSASTKLRPNDPCPCGSGEKYKRCCEAKVLAPPSSGRRILVSVGVVVGITVLVLASQYQRDTAQTRPAQVLPAMPINNGPPGPPPPGKVWSPEHRHWHDAPGSTNNVPSGTLSEGKVWSEEHGHFHDAPK